MGFMGLRMPSLVTEPAAAGGTLCHCSGTVDRRHVRHCQHPSGWPGRSHACAVCGTAGNGVHANSPQLNAIVKGPPYSVDQAPPM